MTFRKRLAVMVTAAVAVAGWAAAAGPAPAARAVTANCGSGCTALYSMVDGLTQVLGVTGTSGDSAAAGQAVGLQLASGADNAEDWQFINRAQVSDLVTAGTISAALNQNYGTEFAYEYEYTPDGIPTGLCLGVPSTATQGETVSLQQCGVDSDTYWVIDTLDFSHVNTRYQPLINGSDTNPTDPFVLTATSAGLTTASLTGTSGDFATDQNWALEFNVMPYGTVQSAEHIILPFYQWPTSSPWSGVMDNAPAVSAVVADICDTHNDGSGCPDQTAWTGSYLPPSAWFTQINALRADGITPLIYIASNYADQNGASAFSLATAESEVKIAVGWFGTGIGFLIDEVPTSCSPESSYYAPLYQYAKSLNVTGPVELDPGTVTATMSCYMHASDILQIFESSEANFQAAKFPSWMSGYPASRFGAVVSGTSSTSGSGISTDVSDAAADGIGNIYVDDEPATSPNFQTLPALWSSEVSDVTSVPPYGVAAMHSLVPAYFLNPSSYWTQLASGSPAVQYAVVDICDPNGHGSGCDGQPAQAANPAWQQNPPPPAAPPPTASPITTLLNAGITPLYYISTSNASVPVATVESEISDAVNWYGTSSFMLDQVPTDCSDVSYYQTLYSYVHNLGGIVVLDPGTVTSTSSCYMSAADILKVFVGSETSFQSATFPSWMMGFPASRFAAVVSGGQQFGPATDVTDAAKYGIGNIYIDDETGTPNYQTLPAFWTAETDDIAGVTPPSIVGAMSVNQKLTTGQSLTSDNGTYTLTMQGDNNLVLYHGSTVLWASNTVGSGATQAVMEGNGDLVLLNSSFTPVWDNGTLGNPGAALYVQDDGNTVVYSTTGKALWATNTSGK